MTESVECVVIGAGVIGLAVARSLAEAGRETVVLEAAQTIGGETSSRNSEVVHAGIYYASGSLKARLCLAGRERLYDYCVARGIPHRRTGKLIVAASTAELVQLRALAATAKANGVADLEWLDPAAVGRLEPAVRCRGALLSPSTGILDSHALLLSLQADAEAAGATVALRAPLRCGRALARGFALEVGGNEPARLRCRRLVNAAGLHAQSVARRIAGVDAAGVPPLHLAKGVYFTLAGRSPFGRLVYPVPEPDGLGLHVTLDLAGRARFGPDVEWVERIDYDVDPARALRFYPAIRRYYPDLAEGALLPGYAGIRPKLAPAGAPSDFCVQGPEEHGLAGLVHLYGIESPGLTACLAIAQLVAERLGVACGER